MSSLETSLQRLSTGLRINSGKDDPAGLIASEMLRSEITSIKQGITNTERANNMIAVADSALNEIAGLLNQIRGLVNEAANTGTMSLEMLKSNQMQVDMMLDSIDRISSQTTFMGRKLLDGSLDFEIGGLMRNEIQNLQVYEAKFGDKGTIDVEVKVRQAAEKASLYYAHTVAQSDVELTIGGVLGQATQRFEKGATVADIAEWVNGISSATGVTAVVHSDATYGTLVTSSVGPNNDIVIRAGQAGQDPGFFQIKYELGHDRGLVVDYQESLGSGYPATMTVYLQTTTWESARATHVDSTPGVHDNNALEFIANIAGEKYNDVPIHYVDGNLTDPRFADAAQNPSGVSRGINSYYSDTAQAATAIVGNINGLRGFSDRKSTRLNSSHMAISRMPSSA
jgi:flagellin-like hook-associated protein FlgL